MSMNKYNPYSFQVEDLFIDDFFKESVSNQYYFVVGTFVIIFLAYIYLRKSIFSSYRDNTSEQGTNSSLFSRMKLFVKKTLFKSRYETVASVNDGSMIEISQLRTGSSRQ